MLKLFNLQYSVTKREQHCISHPKFPNGTYSYLFTHHIVFLQLVPFIMTANVASIESQNALK